MNAKLITAVLGTLALATPMMARADDAPAAAAKAEAKMDKKEKKADKKMDKKMDKMEKKAAAKGGEKSCGADGKSCSGK
jgi:Ni/Co efflux regulator RcnB